MQQDELQITLKLARPGWTSVQLAQARKKLIKVGIRNCLELFQSLADPSPLNEKLKNAGEKAFSGETLQALKAACHSFGYRDGATTRLPAPQLLLHQAGWTSHTMHGYPGANEGGASSSWVVRDYPIANGGRPNEPQQKALPSESTQEPEGGIPDLNRLLMDLNRQEAEEAAGCENKARAMGVPIDSLDASEDLWKLIQRVERLEKMTASKLHEECEKRGFPADEFMPRSELVHLMREVLIWEALDLYALREVCMDQGRAAGSEQSRAECMQLLADSAWENLGVPVTRFASVAEARKVLNQVADLENCGLEKLRALCNQWSLQTDGLDAKGLIGQLKQVFVWRELPASELRAECRSRGVPRSDEASRDELFSELVDSLEGDRFEACGIPANCLERKTAEELLRQVDRLQIMGPLTLEAEFRMLGIAFNPQMERQANVDLLRDVLVWRQLPYVQFEQFCRQFGLGGEGLLLGGPNTRAREEAIALMAGRKGIMINLEKAGVPMKRVKDADSINELLAQCDYIDRFTDTELQDWYKSTGLPEEKGMDTREMANLLKKVTVWQALPLKELRKLCEQVPPGKAEMPDNEEDQKTALVDRLLVHERMEMWDSRGFQAKRIGDPDVVITAITQYEHFRSLSSEELKKTYKEARLPIEADMKTEEMLQTLKVVMLWELVPIGVLESSCRDCLDGRLPATDSNSTAEQRRSVLVRHLITDMLRATYEKNGIPVGRLGVERATDIVAQIESFESETCEELVRALEVFGIPMTLDMPREKLLRHLRNVIVWGALPTSELWVECQDWDIPMHGFDSETEDAELREQLFIRLLLKACHGPSQKPTPEAGKSEKVDPAISEGASPAEPQLDANGQIAPWDWKETWSYIEYMQDPLIAERVCLVPRKKLPRDAYLPAAAKSWQPIEAALFVLSGGVFRPREERPSDVGAEDLISVVCPTSERRQQFHPLLYECFKTQTHEPKELVVVDTGANPSRFFEECAQQDSRVVYRFFPVDDAQVGVTGRSRSQAWSLGLKRNIACYLARGVAIAHFDDDDLYAPAYLSWMWSRLLEVSGLKPESPLPAGGLAPAALKLSDWHLLEIHNFTFSYLDVKADKDIPPRDRRGWLYGWGFSYFFTRGAWSVAPFPDVEFAEDAGFVEGLMARAVPVKLVRLPVPPESFPLVAHSQHIYSTSGGEVSLDSLKRCGRPVEKLSAFDDLMPVVSGVQTGWQSQNSFSKSKLSAKGLAAVKASTGVKKGILASPTSFQKQQQLQQQQQRQQQQQQQQNSLGNRQRR
mmetsp:Transcript_109194/g.209838  ORF Transcript_109194/g.209838 Transcript_109194/m.209838 type:complete len:1279 (+) Transcript_109194:52-3888(+)